jgi:hypothetical protein
MSARNFVLLSLTIFENSQLGAATLAKDFAGDGSLAGGISGEKFILVVHGENVVEGNFGADFAGESFDADSVAWGDAVLLASTANNGVHDASNGHKESSIIEGQAISVNAQTQLETEFAISKNTVAPLLDFPAAHH